MGDYNQPLNCSVIPYGPVGLVPAACWCLEVGQQTCDQVKGPGSYAAAMSVAQPQTIYLTPPSGPVNPGVITQSTATGPWTVRAAIQGTDWGAYQQAIVDHFAQVSTGVLPPTPPTALTPAGIAFIGIGVLALVSVLSSGKGGM